MKRTRSSTLSTLTALALAAGLAACGNDDGGAVRDAGATPDTGIPCTEVPATYTAVHDQILLNPSCAVAGCHTGSGVGGGFDVGIGKAELYDKLINGTSSSGTVPKYVTAGDPSASFLWRKVNDQNPPGGFRMPIGCASNPTLCLTSCQIDAISAWITAGAAND
ncbi:hypothetical protein L6R52_30415 [Myxococcota bacterium]|nr:hypothetical protein [Myxococcota bacterium]